jgi:hypothetical protein
MTFESIARSTSYATITKRNKMKGMKMFSNLFVLLFKKNPLLFFSAQIFFFSLLMHPALAESNSPAAHFPSAPNARGEETLNVRLLSPIQFGKFTSASGGSVVVDARSGSCTGRGGAVMVRTTCAKGIIELRGMPGEQVVVDLPSESPMSGKDGGETILRDFTMDRENPIILGPDGKARIGVGATLTGAGAMKNGEYAGQFQVQTTVLK